MATICESLRRSGCGARLVHLGCASEYGPSQPGSSTAEDAVPRPGGPYGVSKLAATELVLGSGLDAVVLRVFSPVGPGTPAGSPLGRLAEAMRRAMQSGDNELKLGGLGCSGTSSTSGTWPGRCTPPRSPPRRAWSTSGPGGRCGCGRPPRCSPGSPGSAARCTNSTPHRPGW
ncbi:NAD-dependent epimerase/dehydratase family protein [Streptomyces albulus]|nr:NAD-dependent epimerase/dehydratase family protein [Streptomyces noursei]